MFLREHKTIFLFLCMKYLLQKHFIKPNFEDILTRTQTQTT